MHALSRSLYDLYNTGKVSYFVPHTHTPFMFLLLLRMYSCKLKGVCVCVPVRETT